MEHELVKRLVWMSMLAACEALAGIIAARAAVMLYRRVYGEDPE